MILGMGILQAKTLLLGSNLATRDLLSRSSRALLSS